MRIIASALGSLGAVLASASLAQAPAQDALKQILEEGNRIRVFIVYGTALATEQGEILFFGDIYGHDERLQQALNSRREHNVRPKGPASSAPP